MRVCALLLLLPLLLLLLLLLLWYVRSPHELYQVHEIKGGPLFSCLCSVYVMANKYRYVTKKQ